MYSPAKYQPYRKKYWPAIEQFFGELPPPLFEQGVLLKNNLALRYSDTGQFGDILAREQDLPLLYLHFWLLDDLHVPGSPNLIALREHIFQAMFFAFAAVHLREAMLDAGRGFDSHFLFLGQLLTQQAEAHLAHLFPATSPFWNYHHAIWRNYAEAALAGHSSQLNNSTDEIPAPLADKWAFTKIPVAAVAIEAGREAALPGLSRLVDRLNTIYQILRNISTVRRDVMQRKYTYPLLRTMRAAGIDPNQPVAPERILGALLLTDTVGLLCRECLSLLDECHGIAQGFKLETFVDYFAVVRQSINDVMSLFSLKAGPSTQEPKRQIRHAFFVPHIDALPVALQLAEEYLLADLTFRDSWEVQRGLVPNPSTLTAKAFPVGLITEILCRCGHCLPEQVEQIFEMLRASGFCYYEDYPALPPDADDLGLLLRLCQYSGEDALETHQEMLAGPLRWMKSSRLPTAEIPVWFNQNEDAGDDSPSILVWGNSCATTETNLLLGLIDFDWEGYQQIIQESALSILDRFLVSGFGATLYYAPAYILWAKFNLMARLSTRAIQPGLRDKIAQTVPLLVERFEIEAHRSRTTAQAAALLTLAGFHHPAAKNVDPGWVEMLLKQQRHDGSWPGEALFLIPHRRGTAWYASNIMTTAFCYWALKTFSEEQ